MKFVYIIEIGQLSKLKNEFFFYDMEVFPSEKAAQYVINNMIECNKGTDLEIVKSEEGGYRRGEVEHTVFTYNCMSSPADGEEAVPMRVRYVLRKMKVNRNF